MTLLSICTNAADNAGVNTPSSIIGNSDPAAARLLQLARRTARDLAERAAWTALVTEHVFIADGASTYALPADFRSLVDNTMWDRSRYWRMRGAMSPQQWQMYKSSVIGRATVERRWRIRIPSGGAAGASPMFEIDPAIGATDDTSTFVFEYVSKNWCRSATAQSAQSISVPTAGTGTGFNPGDTGTIAGGTSSTAATIVVTGASSGVITAAEIVTPGNYTAVPSNPVGLSSTSGTGTGASFTLGFGGITQPDWAADTDTAILDEDLIELGVLWRLLARLGLAYAEEKDEYERRVALAMARDGGTAILDLAPFDRLTLIGPFNLPETGFGGITS